MKPIALIQVLALLLNTRTLIIQHPPSVMMKPAGSKADPVVATTSKEDRAPRLSLKDRESQAQLEGARVAFREVTSNELKNSTLTNHFLLYTTGLNVDVAIGNDRCGQVSPDVDWSSHDKLTFVHIPRTGGSTVESCSSWFPEGMSSWGTRSENIKGLKKVVGSELISGSVNKCYGQHVPPSMRPETPENNPYNNRESNFCVVRHPYDRLVSQFGFENSFYKGRECTKESMNTWLLQSLKEVKSGKVFLEDCHFTPQSMYVYGIDQATGKLNKNDKWCTNVVHFEH